MCKAWILFQINAFVGLFGPVLSRPTDSALGVNWGKDRVRFKGGEFEGVVGGRSDRVFQQRFLLMI